MVYILIYNAVLVPEEEMKDLLNKASFISDWRTDIINTFLIKSDHSADEIADFLIAEKPNVRFLVSEINQNRQGWLPKDSWSFMRE